MSKVPSVVIIGRVNVGKSTLFNRIAENVRTITLDQAGVTRDYIKDTVCWQNACFNVIDTGGIALKKTYDAILQQVKETVLSWLEKADVILFVVDGTVGVIPEEQELAKLLHKLGKPVVVAINKSDTKASREHMYEFERLGFKNILPISAAHGTAVGDLLDMVVEQLPTKVSMPEKDEAVKVVILGKPNVGKSSLLNALLNEERAIVAEVPGTTREPITEVVTFYKEDIAVTDTPGIRRKRGVKEELETLMVKRAFDALKDTDIALLMVDASEGALADQELKLAFYALEHHKALIILFNKNDLVEEYFKKSYLSWKKNIETFQNIKSDSEIENFIQNNFPSNLLIRYEAGTLSKEEILRLLENKEPRIKDY